jgi:hypothetical protein
MAVATIVLGPGGDAGAAVVGCGETGPQRSLGSYEHISIDLRWDFGATVGTGTIDSDLLTLLGGVPVDLDGDGSDDGRVGLTAAVFNGPAGADPTVDTYHGAADFVVHSPAYALLRDGYGVDYAAETTVEASGDDATEGPSHLRFSLTLDDPARWPAGTFGADVSLPYTDGTEGAPEQFDVYKVRLDTTGAVVSGGATVWAPVTEVSVFDDSLLHDTLALGVITGAGTDTASRLPTSNLAVDVLIEQVGDVPRQDHLRLGLTGPLAKDGTGAVTSVGMPGEMAAVVLNDCDGPPQQTFVGIGHDGDPAIDMPDGLDLDLSVYGDGAGDDGTFDPDTERTLYADATITAPPNTVDVTIGADDADVDGDGTLDAFDLDGDLGDDDHGDDRLPWEHVSVHHDGTTVRPDLAAVIARRPVGPAEAPLYLAGSIEDLPPDTSFDRSGVPSGTDADGDGEWDDVNGDGVVDPGDVSSNADQGSLAFCPKDFTTYPADCTVTAVAAGRTKVAFQPEIPAANAGGHLPLEARMFGPAPADLTATTAAHFPLTPSSWVTTAIETTTTVLDNGSHVVRSSLTSAGVDVTGLEAVTWDLSGTGRVDVETDGMASFGAQVTTTDLTGGGHADLWSALADVPDNVALSFDTENLLRDGDPVELTWASGRERTGAAVAIDALLPDDVGEGDRTIAGSAWIGTGNGADDGLPTNMTLTVDLVDGVNRIQVAPLPPECSGGPLPNFPWPGGPGGANPCPGTPDLPGPTPSTDPMALDVGFTTRTQAEEAAGLATRGRVSVGIPQELTLKWTDDGTTISSATVLTCEPDLVAGEDDDDVEPCPAVDLAATVVTDDFTGPVGHDALLGVDMIPVPDEDGHEFPDFTALPGTAGYPADWAHVVLFDDPIIGDNSPTDDEVVDASNRAGFDIHLAEIDELAFGAATTVYDPSGPQHTQEVFNRLDACFEGAVQTPRPRTSPALGLGFYQGESPAPRIEAAATWVDATLTTDSTELNATVETNTPAPDRGGVVGDLNNAQLEYATEHPDETNLAQVTTEDCEGDWHGGNRTLTGRVRRGTEQSVAKVLELGAQSAAAGRGNGLPVPATRGVDAALYSAKVGDTSYQGLDAAVRLDLPTRVSIRQPVLRRCGLGNWNLEACHDLPTYDATTTSDVFLEVTSSSESSLGDLDVEYLTEPAELPADEPDECGTLHMADLDLRHMDACAQRTALHIDSLGTGITVEGTLEQRASDGYLHADVDVTNRSGLPLDGVELRYGDDYRPATLGDPSEGGDTDQPIAWLVLDDAGGSLAIDATMWAPVYGWNGTAYTPDDCREGWPGGGAVQDDHVFPAGDEPSGWRTLGPRTDDIRPAYLHGRIDLDPYDADTPADTITVEVDNRIDQPADYDRPSETAVENWYDDTHRHATKVGIDTDGALTEGELWGAFPGLQVHEHQDSSGEFEVCADVDVPLNVEWSDASDVRGAVDLLKATFSLLDAEKAAGGDLTVAVRERTTADFVTGPPQIVTGIWAHELKTWLHAPLGKDWATNVTDDRMSVGFLDPGDLKLEVLPHDEIEMQDDLASGWAEAGVSGNRFYGSVLLQALFHPDVEAILADDKGLADVVDAWAGNEGLWQTLDDRTDTIVDRELPSLAPDTPVVDGPFAHQTHHECRAEEKKAEHDEFVPLAVTSDGSTFEIAARWDNQRVQLFLIGRYANGEVRYVRELDDSNPPDKACMLHITGDIQIDEATGATTVEIDVDVTNKTTPTDEQWNDGFDGAFLFDASGNGWALSTQAVDLLEATGAVAGEPVTITDLTTYPGEPSTCVWYPGDGTRITPGDPDVSEDGTSVQHTYAFPGTYQAMKVCYRGPLTAYDRVQDPYGGQVTKGTVTVDGPG